MSELRPALQRAVDVIAGYREALPTAPVGPGVTRAEVRGALRAELPGWVRPGPA